MKAKSPILTLNQVKNLHAALGTYLESREVLAKAEADWAPFNTALANGDPDDGSYGSAEADLYYEAFSAAVTAFERARCSVGSALRDAGMVNAILP